MAVDGYGRIVEAIEEVAKAIILETDGMKHVPLTCDGNTIYSDGIALNFEEVKSLVESKDNFVYLIMDNIWYLPAMDVPNTGIVNSVAFTVAWTRHIVGDDYDYNLPFISRVIINSENVVQVSQNGVQNTDLLMDDISDTSDWSAELLKTAYPSVGAVKAFVEAEVRRQLSL